MRAVRKQDYGNQELERPGGFLVVYQQAYSLAMEVFALSKGAMIKNPTPFLTLDRVLQLLTAGL